MGDHSPGHNFFRNLDDDGLVSMDHRGLVLEAAADIPRQAPRLALYDDPSQARRDLFDETRSLLDDAGVLMVSPTA